MPSSNKCTMARRRNGAIFSACAVLILALLCAGVTAGGPSGLGDAFAASDAALDEAGAGQTHVDAVSGATLTSRAVVDCLNIALAAYAQMGGN